MLSNAIDRFTLDMEMQWLSVVVVVVVHLVAWVLRQQSVVACYEPWWQSTRILALAQSPVLQLLSVYLVKTQSSWRMSELVFGMLANSAQRWSCCHTFIGSFANSLVQWYFGQKLQAHLLTSALGSAVTKQIVLGCTRRTNKVAHVLDNSK
jgi:hypothetical protein